jgi:hypothetical protein
MLAADNSVTPPRQWRWLVCLLIGEALYIYRMPQKDVYTRLIFHIIMCIHLFGILCILLMAGTII